MKTRLSLLHATGAIFIVSVLLSSCEDAPPAVRPRPIDTTIQIKEQLTLHPDDVCEGHPFQWAYMPHETRLPLDTLRNTNFMLSVIYADTLGWGLNHFSYFNFSRRPHRVLPIVLFPFQAFPGLENYKTTIWASARFSRTTNGMLEYSDYGGRTNTKFTSEGVNSSFAYFPHLERAIIDFGNNPSTLSQIDIRNLIEGGYWLGRISLGQSVFPDSSYPPFDFLSLYVGSTVEWGASPRMYSENLYDKVGEKIAPIAQQRAYLPRLLRVMPENKEITDTLHKKGESLTISWQGDENNQQDSIAIVVTNYHANFVTFPHFTTQYPVATTMLGARKGMVFFPPNRRRITTSAWDDLEDTVVAGGTPTRWYKIVKEESGKNIFTIPSEVFANAVNGEVFDIRCYRWNDIVTEVNPIAYTKEGFEEKWLIGPGAKERASVRSRLRVVTMSVGRVMIYE